MSSDWRMNRNSGRGQSQGKYKSEVTVLKESGVWRRLWWEVSVCGLSKARIGRAGVTNGQGERELRKIVNWLETSLRLSGLQEFNEVKNKDENKQQKHEWYLMEKSNYKSILSMKQQSTLTFSPKNIRYRNTNSKYITPQEEMTITTWNLI